MKIGVRKIGPLGNMYGNTYGEDHFKSLWQKYLLDRLEDEDRVVWFEHMPVDPAEFDNMLTDLDAVIGAWIFKNMITDETLSKHPNLRYIGTVSHGYGPFDRDACFKHGVTVTNTRFNDYAVAQHTMALLLEIASNIGTNNQYYKNWKWEKNEEMPNKLFTKQMELKGKTIGIIGLGSIGYRVAKMAEGFGMNVLSFSKHVKKGNQYSFVKQVDLETLYHDSDIITLHCPSNEDTYHMINKVSIDMMKNGVIIINCARGDLIDERSLIDALNHPEGSEGCPKVYAAGLDVFEGEPLQAPSELLKHPHVVATEHIAWATPEARERSIKVACDNFFNWRMGNPTSVIS